MPSPKEKVSMKSIVKAFLQNNYDFKNACNKDNITQ